MSYCFDTLSRAWRELEEKLPQEVRDGEFCMRFGFMLEELHECDHRLRGAINQDARVTKHARALENAQRGKVSE